MLDNFRAWRERRSAIREFLALQKVEAWEVAHSDTNPLLQAQASIAIGDHEAALRNWNHARIRYPSYVKAAPETLGVLLGLKLFDDAEAIMLEGKKHSPGDPKYTEGYALIAQRREDWAEAVARWQDARRKFPGSWKTYVNAARALNELERLSEAEKLLKQAISRFPGEVHCWWEYASLAEVKKDWEMARSLWCEVTERFEHVVGVIGQARAMMSLGQAEEAASFLMARHARFPHEPEVMLELARIAKLNAHIEQAPQQ